MTPQGFRRYALSLPEAHEEPHFERTSFRVGKKIFATMSQDGRQAMVRVPRDLVQTFLSEHPKTFFSYGAWTIRQGALGVWLREVNAAMMRELLVGSWKSVVPRKVAAAFDDG